MKLAKATRRLLVQLFGPEFVCTLVGHVWREDPFDPWESPPRCQRCNLRGP